LGKGQGFLGNPAATARGSFRHLNIVITDPDEEQNYLVVPVTTYHTQDDGTPFSGQDKSCLLGPGDHPFIKHDSYVKYAKARIMSFIEIFNGIRKGILIAKEDVDAQVLKAIQDGAKKSPYLREELNHFFDYF
jgi:hypothetical protein